MTQSPKLNAGWRLAVALALLGAAGGAGAQTMPMQTEERVTVTPTDTGAALVNPDMGWTLMFYSNIPANYGSKLEPADTVDDWPGLAVVYLRVPWAFLEPEEGKFNWALLDTPAQRWIAKGKRIALRLTCSENWLRFATPQWVQQAGAQGTFYKLGKGPADDGEAWDPRFDDPVFLAKLDRFLAAAARRYDGNPNVAFIDVGSYGLWGEGHTGASSRVPDDRAEAIIRQHIDLHLKHFPKTLLVANDDFVGHDKPGRHFPITDYALAKGLTLRDDSILVQPPPRAWFHAELAQSFWPARPVIVEHEHFGSSKQRGAWGDGSLLLKAVEEYHASYLTIHWWPREELAENRAVVERINRRLGYRLQVRRLSWPARVTVGQSFTAEMEWANAGVAPCYPGGFPALTLKDAKGGIVAVLVDEGLDLRTLPVGPAEAAPVQARRCEFAVGKIAPVTKPGKCDVFVSAGLADGTPRLALPLADDDGQRRYRVGTVTVEGGSAAK